MSIDDWDRSVNMYLSQDVENQIINTHGTDIL